MKYISNLYQNINKYINPWTHSEKEPLADASWKLILNKNEIDKCVELCATKINSRYQGKRVVIVCILKNAIYFFTDLTRKLTIPHSVYFIEASYYRDQQTYDANIESLSKIIPSKFTGKHVVIIDELYDNNIMMHVKNAIKEQAGVSEDYIYICTLFLKYNKVKNHTETEPNFYAIRVPDVKLVGYGLDDQQEKRNLNCLYVCPKDENITKIDDNYYYYYSGNNLTSMC